MGILSWVVDPALAPDNIEDPIGAAITRVGVLTVGLIWQFVLSLIIVRREGGDLRWATLRRRLWLNRPQDPRTGQPRGLLWLWVAPLLILVALLNVGLSVILNDVWVSLFPFFAEPASFAFGSVPESSAVQAQPVGAWGFLGLFVVNVRFNTSLGEEFLFRGELSPKMRACLASGTG